MKQSVFIFLALLSLNLLSCGGDDDNNADDGNNILVNTLWIGEQTSHGKYTFSSNTTFTFDDIGEDPVNGIYTFNGTSGVLTEETGYTTNFSVSGSIMSVDGLSASGGATIKVYIKQ